MGQRLSELAGWGRHPVLSGGELLTEDLERGARSTCLSRGLGRSYGDASLPSSGAARVLTTRLADRFLAFDTERGVLRAEAGLSLGALQALVLPHGWTSPVLPGTAQVTLGGMLAADVHGKNHHVVGCLGQAVRGVRLVVADGRVLDIGPDDEPELFAGTVGGMGLTGHITEVELQLEAVPSSAIAAWAQPFEDLPGVLAGLRSASAAAPFSMAWVDALADRGRTLRGVVHSGRWARTDELPGSALPRPRRWRVPQRTPRLVGRRSVGAFNARVFRKHRPGTAQTVVHPDRFFHPLDNVTDWNRLYGDRGFVQHQCVLPDEPGDLSLGRLFQTLAQSEVPALLAVLKTCGEQGPGLLSFPRSGVSVALDLPRVRDATQALVDRLNEVVLEAGGRIYLAKDALTRREHWQAMEAERLPAFNALRAHWDPEGRFRSALSVRLLGDDP